MTCIKLATALAALLATATAALGHTNTVGFLLTDSTQTDCTSGPDGDCYDVEIFYGSWHSGSVAAEGHLAIFRIEGGVETQVIGQTAIGGTATPFSTSHSKIGSLPNGLSGSPNYATTGTYYDALKTVFTLGSNYFYSCGGDLYGTLASCPSTPSGVYSHQSAVAPALGPGTYRIDYDAATKFSLSATWQPDGPIGSAVFTIAAGGGVIVSDGEQPVVSLAGPSDPIDTAFTVTASFNEDVTGFELNDIVVNNGTASDFVTVSATDYTFTVTPDGSQQTVVIEVPADSAIDSGSNGNARSNLLNVLIIEEIPPQVTLTGPSGTQIAPFTVTATFDEPVTGFEFADVVVSNASLSNFNAASSTVYTFTVTPDGSNRGITVDVPANVAQDAQANQNVASNQFYSPPLDNTPPTVSLSGPSSPQEDQFTVTASFDEPVAGFQLSDIVISQASGSNFLAVSPAVYTFTVTPDGTGRGITVDVPSSVAQDLSGNNNSAASQYTMAATDTTPPSVVLSGPSTPQDSPFTVMATFSEDVTGFEIGDIAVDEGTASDLNATSASVYTFTVTPNGTGRAITVDVASSVAQDTANNANTAASQFATSPFDTTSPSLALTGPTTPQENAFTVTAIFSEDVSGFEIGDITTGEGTASDLVMVNARTYTFMVSPNGTGRAITVDVASDVAQDSAYNGNTAAPQFAIGPADTTPPSVVLTGPTEPQANPYTVTATFSENVTGFTLDDVTSSNSTLDNFTAISPSVYTFQVTPDGTGRGMTVDVAAGSAEDAAYNGNTTADQFVLAPFDTTPPSVALTGPTEPQTDPYTVTATFSEDVTGFELSDVISSNSTLGSFVAVSGSVYTFTVTPDGTGRGMTVDIAANIAEDAANNGNTVAPQYVLGPADVTRPTVILTGPTDPQQELFTMKATFSEEVTGFGEVDITVTGGTLSNFVIVSPSVYTFDITPDGSSDMLRVQVAEGVAEDAAYNSNISGGYSVALSPMFRFDEDEERLQELVRSEAVRDLRSSIKMNRSLVTGARERMMARLGGSNCGTMGNEQENTPLDDIGCNDPVTRNHVPFDIDGSAGISGPNAFLRGSFFGASGGQVNRLSFGEFHFTSYDDGTVTGTLSGRLAWEAMVGVHTLQGFYVGGDLVRSDISGDFAGARNAAAASAGAYLVHAAGPNLFFDGYASVGIGHNVLDVSNATLAVDGDYTATTFQFGGAVTGVFPMRMFELRPELSFAYGHTNIGDGAFDATSGGIVLPAVLEGGSVSLGEIRLEPEIVLPLAVELDFYDSVSLKLAPSLVCERIEAETTQTDCGGGASVSYTAVSEDGLRSLRAEARYETTHGVGRKSVNLRIEHAF